MAVDETMTSTVVTASGETGMRARAAEPAFLSVKDLTVRWQVSRSVAYKTVASEGFPAALKFGTTLRFSRELVEEWENQQMELGRQ